LRQLQRAKSFKQWANVRNFLLHRAVPKRQIEIAIGHGLTSHSWIDFGIELSADELTKRLQWLEMKIESLLTAMWEFADPEIVGPGDERKRRGDFDTYLVACNTAVL
jgi:hypothetical protein